MSKVGIVYQIECNETGEIYIGSTVQCLEERIKAHINDIKTYENGNAVGICVSSLIIKRDNYIPSVLKEIEFDDPDDLLWEERWSIEACDKAINIKKPILTEEERDELNKQSKRNYSKNFYHKNPELCKERNKEYRKTEKGKQSKAESDKKYREGPKREELLAKKREDSKAKREGMVQTTCECGGTYFPNGKNRHLKTKKHLDFINF